jgi:hypothetical protein
VTAVRPALLIEGERFRAEACIETQSIQEKATRLAISKLILYIGVLEDRIAELEGKKKGE